MLVRHGQGIAVDAIAGPEVALEIGRPQIVRVCRRRRHDTGMRVGAPPAPFLDQSAAGQQVARGAGRGQLQLGRAPAQPLQDLSWAPARMLPPCPADRVGHRGRDAVRAVVRRSAPFAQPRGAFRVVPGEPFVASLSAHPVALTQLTHRVQVLFTIDDEPHPLVHGCRLRPRHALPPWESSLSGVTHVPGEICYLCTRFVPKRVFLDHGARGLKTRVDPEERELTLARAKVGELTMRLELAEHLIEKRASWTTGGVSAMRDTVRPGTGCRYPLTMICRCGGSRSRVSLDGRSTGVASPTQFGHNRPFRPPTLA